MEEPRRLSSRTERRRRVELTFDDLRGVLVLSLSSTLDDTCEAKVGQIS